MKATFITMITVILAFTLPLLIIGCSGNDDSPTAPKNQPKAAGTMSALIDDVSWSAGGNPTGQKSAYAWYTLSNGHLSIYGKKYNAPATTGSSINLSIAAFGEGAFSLSNSGNYAIYKRDDPYFESDIINTTGTVTITKFDKNNKIVQGTFECQVKGIGGVDINGHIYYVYINITNGKFDVEYIGEN
ncbi:MAG: DUF6252 family protein [Patescibacteria group bacterium]|nr:DUF6252 family protein [Patescibacteria group bacterium]